MAPIVKKTYIDVGESGDGTEESIESCGLDLEIIPTVWDDRRKDGGEIYSEYTNVPLFKMRKDLDKEVDGDAWGLYLQSDEVVHEDELELIREDLRKAEEQGCDVVRFRYIHFWLDHNRVAINKKWYPQEIRAVRIFSDVESWGDAQSFRHFKKIYDSDAHIYHYGHVRDQKAYEEKIDRQIKYYNADIDIEKYAKKWKKKDAKTETLPIFCDHPKVMKERFERIGGIFEQDLVDEVYIVGDISEGVKEKINANRVYIVERVREVPRESRDKMVIMKPSITEKLFYSSHVPDQMRSKLARPWTEDFKLLLKLSEKGIGFKHL